MQEQHDGGVRRALVDVALAEAVDFDVLELVRELWEVVEAAGGRADELDAVVRGADDGLGVAVELFLGG